MPDCWLRRPDRARFSGADARILPRTPSARFRVVAHFAAERREAFAQSAAELGRRDAVQCRGRAGPLSRVLHAVAARPRPARSRLGAGRRGGACSSEAVRPELAGRVQRQAQRVILARIRAVVLVFELDHPALIIAHEIVASVRHGFLLTRFYSREPTPNIGGSRAADRVSWATLR